MDLMKPIVKQPDYRDLQNLEVLQEYQLLLRLLRQLLKICKLLNYLNVDLSCYRNNNFSLEMKIEELEGDRKTEPGTEMTTKKTTVSKIT